MEQNAFADQGVARALSLAKTILDAGEAGLTKDEIRAQVEFYRDAAAEGQTWEGWDRQFSRDKQYLRESGVPVQEAVGENDYRYCIDPEDYGVKDLNLTGDEKLALQRAQLVFINSNIRGLDHALWAVNPTDEPVADHAVPEALQASVGTDVEIERLMRLASIGMRKPVSFQYTSRGRLTPQPRTVVPLGTAARGHWYLIAHCLDREELRTFRLDRIHGRITSATLKDRDEKAVATDIASGALYGDFDTAHVMARLPDQDNLEHILEGAATAHSGPPPVMPKLRPLTLGRLTDAAQSKIDRVLNMGAFLMASDGARPSQLLRKYGITAEQLQRDLLSLQQTGTFQAHMGEFSEVHPLPPLTVEEFKQEYLVRDEVITLDAPGIRSAAAMARPASLTKPGALGLIIALKALIDVCPPGEEHIIAAARTLQNKLVAVVPEKLHAAAQTMVLSRTPADARALAVVRSAIHQGTCVQIDYLDSEARRSHRVIEPVQLVYDGPYTYVRAWCRRAQGERLFRLDKIQSLHALQQQERSVAAQSLDLSTTVRPHVPRTDDSLQVVLRFSPSAAGLAERFSPQRSATEDSGARIIETYYRSQEALIQRLLEAGGDIELLEPEDLRDEVFRRARADSDALKSSRVIDHL